MVIAKKSTILILISTMLFGSAAIALIYYLPSYLQFIGIEIPLIQFSTSFFPLASIFFPVYFGRLSDKYQNRYWFFLSGSIGVSIVVISIIFTSNIIIIIALLIIYGIFNSLYRLIFSLYQELVENDARLVSIYNAISVMGWFIGSQIGGIYIDFFGISSIFFLLLVLSVINVIIVSFIREDRNLILDYFEMEEVNEKLDNLEEIPISKSIYISLFFRHFGVRPIITILAILMAFHLNNETEIGFLLGFNPLLQFFFMLITGKIVSPKNEKCLMSLGYLCSSIAILGYAVSNDFISFLLSQILISLGFSLFWNPTQIFIAERTNPKNKGTLVGYANASFLGGGFLGGIFFSFLLLIYYDYYAVIWIMGIFPLISLLSILFKFPKRN